MVAHESPAEVVRQIQQAWAEAQAQLTALREQVEEATALAQAKVRSTALGSALDEAYRDLGEAVWTEVSKGRLRLPPQLAALQKALEVVTGKVRAQNASIRELLAEGEMVARRTQEKGGRASKGVANPNKKR